MALDQPLAPTALRYPETAREDVVDEMFGETVADPYRWLEDADSALAAYQSLLDDPAGAAAMGARARERVLDEHTYAHRARQVLRLLELESAVPV